MKLFNIYFIMLLSIVLLTSCSGPIDEHFSISSEHYSANYDGEDCPDICEDEVTTEYEGCQWSGSLPYGQYAPRPGGENGSCDPGVPLNIIGKHRIFVHGLHGGSWSFQNFYSKMNYKNSQLGYITHKPVLGTTSTYGGGTADIDDWATELAEEINTVFQYKTDVEIVAHSFGVIVTEFMLLKGYQEKFTGSTYDLAAGKISSVIAIQGAHGGCMAGQGDLVAHGTHGSCPASIVIGKINQGEWVHDMNKVLWADQGLKKTIKYITAHDQDGGNSGDRCTGKAGFICSNSNLHDGVVKKSQMVPPSSWPGMGLTSVQNLITVTEPGGQYCHMNKQENPIEEDTYPAARVSNVIFNSLFQNYDFNYKTGTPYTYETTSTVCDYDFCCAPGNVYPYPNELCNGWEDPDDFDPPPPNPDHNFKLSEKKANKTR